MPIDSSIGAQIRLPRINTPFESLQRIVADQDAQSQAEARRVAIEQRRRQMAEQDAFQQAIQQIPDFSDQSLDQLLRVAPTYGMAFRDKLVGQRKDMAATAETELKNQKAEHDMGQHFLAVAEAGGPEAYAAVLPSMSKLMPELAQFLGPQYDPQKIQAAKQFGVDQQKKLEQQHSALTELFKGNAGSLAQQFKDEQDPQEREGLLKVAALWLGPQGAAELARNPDAFLMTPAAKEQAADRDASRALTARGQDMTAATAAAGQQVTMRGQNMAAATAAAGREVTKRGQDMTDARAAKGGAEGAKLSAAAVEKVAGADTALGSLKWIDENLKRFEGSLGPVVGNIQQMKQKTPLADKGYAEFAAEVATLKNSIVKATTGAAMSEPEAQRILQQAPDLDQQPAVFRARLAATKRNLEMIRNRTIELSGGTPAAPAAPQEMKIGPYTVRVK